MRVLFTVHGYKPAYRLGGPIHSVSAMAEALTSKGHEVTVFTTNSNLDEDLDVPVNVPINVNGVTVWYFERFEFFKKYLPFVPYLSRASGFVSAKHMARHLDRDMPTFDVVHTHLPFIYPTIAAARAATRHSKPLFYSQRGVLDPERLKFRGAKKRLYLHGVEMGILRQATTLIALTEAEVNSYRRLRLNNPCRIVPNGIDVSSFATHAEDYPGIDRSARVILFLGRIHPTKGADILLDAFLRVCSQFPDARLVFAGPDEFGLEGSLRGKIPSRDMQARVSFLGMVTGEAKRQLLARANLFCLPSQAEGFSMSALEALASGTPVILSPGCHFDEVQVAGAGVVVARTVDAFALAIERVLSSAELMANMSIRARLLAQKYGWPEQADKLISAYEEGLARHNAGLGS